MSLATPFDLLIECGGCGLENLISGFTPNSHAICNQCRENMLAYDLEKMYQGHICDACERVLLLKKGTDFVNGESECQCGNQDFTDFEMKRFSDTLTQTREHTFDNLEDDASFDWCRPTNDSLPEDDYNEIFDDDPGFK